MCVCHSLEISDSIKLMTCVMGMLQHASQNSVLVPSLLSGEKCLVGMESFTCNALFGAL